MLNTIRSFVNRTPFRKEITMVILVKLFALFLLWWLFFSHPYTNMLNPANLSAHFIKGAPEHSTVLGALVSSNGVYTG
jgi:hypothetical protein